MSASTMTVVPGSLEFFQAVEEAVSAAIAAAGSADTYAHFAAAMTALGPIGAGFGTAYFPAQTGNLVSTLQVALIHAMTGVSTQVAKVGYVATDAASAAL